MPPKKSAKQLSLPHFSSTRRRKEHGGEVTRGKRKVTRPLSLRLSVHVVLRSEKAKGCRSLNNNSRIVKSVIYKASRHFRVKVYSYAINHNHLHLSVRGSRIIEIQNFFRVLAGHIAQQILIKFPLPKISPGNAPMEGLKSKYKRKFWEDLIYSRLVTWGREFIRVKKYIELNELESRGLISRLKLNKKKPTDHQSKKSRPLRSSG